MYSQRMHRIFDQAMIELQWQQLDDGHLFRYLLFGVLFAGQKFANEITNLCFIRKYQQIWSLLELKVIIGYHLQVSSMSTTTYMCFPAAVLFAGQCLGEKALEFGRIIQMWQTASLLLDINAATATQHSPRNQQ